MSESGQEEMADCLKRGGRMQLRSVIFFSFFLFFFLNLPLFWARNLPSRWVERKEDELQTPL